MSLSIELDGIVKVMRPANDQFRVLRDLNSRFLSYILDPMHVPTNTMAAGINVHLI